MVSEKIFEGRFFSYIALYIHMTPWDVASLEPRGLIGRIYIRDHYTLLHTKYIICGPHGFREEYSLSFHIISLWELMIPGAWPVWTPGA